jgi:phosphonate transport system substrate-binding protein
MGTKEALTGSEKRSMEKQDSSQSPAPIKDKDIKRTAKIIFAVILLIGASVALYKVMNEIFPSHRASHIQIRNRINLEGENVADTVPAGTLDTRREIRIAIAPIVSPEKSMEMYEPFVGYVAGKLGMKPMAIYRPTYSETNDLVRYQQCDIAIVGTYPFIRGEREFGMQALVVQQISGERAYQSIIIVPKTSRAKTIFDLRGKRFASADIMSTTGWLFPAMLLMNAGEVPDNFFGQHILTRSHDRSMQAVVDEFVDGAAVHGLVYNQMIEENPSLLQKVKILTTSGPFGIPPVVAHPNLDPKLRQAIQSVLLNMHEDAHGKPILKMLQIERFIIPDAHLFDSLRSAVGKLERWR